MGYGTHNSFGRCFDRTWKSSCFLPLMETLTANEEVLACGSSVGWAPLDFVEGAVSPEVSEDV
jgi:hypothetical protein